MLYEVITIDRVADLYPIERSMDRAHGWLDRLRQDFRGKSTAKDYKMNHQNHAARCPGIFNLLRMGWVMRTWTA